ncbi:hypothetical protein ACVGXN_00500, partial [Enterobacter hormaechei]
VDAAREGASRRFRAVMMTAVSFIIGVLAHFVGPPAGSHIPPKKGKNVINRKLVGTLVGKFLKTAHFLLLKPHRQLGHPHNHNNPTKKKTKSTKKKKNKKKNK